MSLSHAQQKDSVRLGQVNIYERFPENPEKFWARGSTLFGHFNFKGKLVGCIYDLWNVTTPYIRFNKKPPVRYLEYNAVGGNSKLSKDYIKDCVEDHFHFKVTDIKDSCEVWIADICDTSLFNQKSFSLDEFDGNGSESDDDNFLYFKGGHFDDIIDYFESTTSRILLSNIDADVGTGRYFNFQIPLSILNSFGDFDSFLRGNYGIGLKKERQLVNLKFVKFE